MGSNSDMLAMYNIRIVETLAEFSGKCLLISNNII